VTVSVTVAVAGVSRVDVGVVAGAEKRRGDEHPSEQQ
jgi:hypothetical protein